MKRFEGESSRQKAYNKRKNKIVRKAQELTTLCETDLALLMVSPDGQLTSFGSNGRVEDTFIRFLELADEYKRGPIQNAEQLTQKLRELKKEAEVLEKMATVEALQEKLAKINRRTEEVREKLRFYDPDVEKINSVAEAEFHEQYLISAIERIKLSREELLREQAVGPDTESKERAGDDMKCPVPFADQSAITIKRRRGRPRKNQSPHMNTHLSNDLIQAQTSWNLQGGQHSSMINKQILQQGTTSYETAADDMKRPVPIIDQSVNTHKRRRGRPRKNRSPHINTHLSNNLIQAQNDWDLQAGQHSSNKQI